MGGVGGLLPVLLQLSESRGIIQSQGIILFFII